MTLMKFGVLIALLVVACFVGSAPVAGYPLQLLPEDTSEAIGNSVFSFNVPGYLMDGLKNKTGDGDVAGHSFRSASVQFWNDTALIAVYFELCYFPGGVPPVETANKVFLEDFEKKTGGRIWGVNKSYVEIASYPAGVWNVYHPMTRRAGFITQVWIDDKRVVNILADPLMFDSIYHTLRVGVATEENTFIDDAIYIDPRTDYILSRLGGAPN